MTAICPLLGSFGNLGRQGSRNIGIGHQAYQLTDLQVVQKGKNWAMFKVFVQLILGPDWSTNQLYKNPNIS